MSSLLDLAAEFLDRMTNPSFGAQVNDEYAQRFAALFEGDFEARLRREVGALTSTDALTPYAWSWLLDWARTNDAHLDDELLLSLCQEWESAAFKATVIEAAISGRQLEREATGGVDEFPDQWLRQLLTNAIASREEDVARDADRPTMARRPQHSRHAQSLLMALLLVEEDLTIAAAAVLLREPWDGHQPLLEYFWSRFDALDEETRAAWEVRLEPPSRPRS